MRVCVKRKGPPSPTKAVRGRARRVKTRTTRTRAQRASRRALTRRTSGLFRCLETPAGRNLVTGTATRCPTSNEHWQPTRWQAIHSQTHASRLPRVHGGPLAPPPDAGQPRPRPEGVEVRRRGHHERPGAAPAAGGRAAGRRAPAEAQAAGARARRGPEPLRSTPRKPAGRVDAEEGPAQRRHIVAAERRRAAPQDEEPAAVPGRRGPRRDLGRPAQIRRRDAVRLQRRGAAELARRRPGTDALRRLRRRRRRAVDLF